MIIAQQKRRDNIAEYLLYLWQVEDLLRACQLDIDKVEKAVISRYDVDEKTRHEIKEAAVDEALYMLCRALKKR